MFAIACKFLVKNIISAGSTNSLTKVPEVLPCANEQYLKSDHKRDSDVNFDFNIDTGCDEIEKVTKRVLCQKISTFAKCWSNVQYFEDIFNSRVLHTCYLIKVVSESVLVLI